MDTNRKEDKLYSYQVLLLIVAYRVMLGLTYLPALNTPPANQDIWIMLLFSILYTILLPLPLLYLSNRFSDMNLFQYSEVIMGKSVGKIIGILYILFFLAFLIFYSSVFIEILDVSLYDQTPTIINIFILIITCAYIVNKGIMNIARLGTFVIPFMFIIFLLLIILGAKNYDFQVFFPILSDSTFSKINRGAFMTSLRYTDVLIYIMMIPFLKEKKDINRIFLKSVIYSKIILILTVVVIQATLGVEYAKKVNFPFYTFTRLIVIGEAQGFDLLYMIIWIIGNIIKISGYFYFTTVAFGAVTNRKNQIFIIPVAIAVAIAVTLIKDYRPVVATREYYKDISLLTSFIFMAILPSIIFIVYFFRRKRLSGRGDR